MLNDRFGRTRLLLGTAILGTIAASLTISTLRAFAPMVAVACMY